MGVNTQHELARGIVNDGAARMSGLGQTEDRQLTLVEDLAELGGHSTELGEDGRIGAKLVHSLSSRGVYSVGIRKDECRWDSRLEQRPGEGGT